MKGKTKCYLSYFTHLFVLCVGDIWNGDEDQNEREIMHTLWEAHRTIENKLRRSER